MIQHECPICMDVIDMTRNCVTTECGHCFHSSCLMNSVAHIGFGCPYCRTVMADKPEDDDDSDYESDDGEEAEDNDYALRGLRFMNNIIEGLPHDDEDLQDEEDDVVEDDNDVVINDINLAPSSTFITQKLISKGVDMEQLVKILLLNHNEYN